MYHVLSKHCGKGARLLTDSTFLLMTFNLEVLSLLHDMAKAL